MRTPALLLALALSGKLAAASPISPAFGLVLQPVSSIHEAASSECGTILECLRSEKHFSKLLRFVEEHGGNLRDDLERDGITLLAPTDEAFEYLEEALDSVRSAHGRRRDNGRRLTSVDNDDLEDVEAEGRGRKGRKRRPHEIVDEEDGEVGTVGRGKGRKRRPRVEDDEDEVDAEGRGKGRKRRPRDDDDDDDDYSDGRRGGGRDKDKHDMEELLRYHIVEDELSEKDLYEGMLLKTKLKLDELDGKRQRIRVMEFNDDYYLNFHSRVDEHLRLRPKKGRILAINRVLCLPMDAMDMMAMMPFKFSTTLVAAGKLKLLEELEGEKAITVFAPDNHAWMNLGIQNMQYLFSHKGAKDLKKILEYHIVPGDVAYSEKIMEEGEMCHKTLLKKEEICVCAHEREEGNRDGHDRHKSKGGNNDRRRNQCSVKRSLGGDHEKCEPKNWIFSINHGESRITITDVLAENGVIHPISMVLIPPEIELPHECSKDEIKMF